MKIICVTLILVIISIIAQAQPPKTQPSVNREKIEAMKVSFLTNKMNLTPEEAQKFWPVYNQYRNEMKTLRKDKKELASDIQLDIDAMTDTEVSQLIDQKFMLEQKEMEIKKKYLVEYKKVIPIKKLAAFYKGEEEFKVQLLRQAANKK